MRRKLEPEEQTLLILRLDRGLSWDELATVMAPASAATLRKRFERLRERISELVRANGLL